MAQPDEVIRAYDRIAEAWRDARVAGAGTFRKRPWVDRLAILTVAVEEMGHLLCVQNLLCLLGGPVNLDREDYPWDTPYYPFPFRLEPISPRALSCYVFAEMPLDTPKGKAAARRYREFQREDRAKILRTVRRYSRRDQPHRVGEIYETVLELISDETKIPDACFDPSTRLAVDQRHDIVEDVVGFAGVVNRQDVRVLEAGGELDLPQEPVATHPGRAVGAQHLDRNPPSVPAVGRREDASHASGADLVFEDVAVAESRPEWGERVGQDRLFPMMG
jgi:hypothetical protein